MLENLVTMKLTSFTFNHCSLSFSFSFSKKEKAWLMLGKDQSLSQNRLFCNTKMCSKNQLSVFQGFYWTSSCLLSLKGNHRTSQKHAQVTYPWIFWGGHSKQKNIFRVHWQHSGELDSAFPSQLDGLRFESCLVGSPCVYVGSLWLLRFPPTCMG